jgi:hypothetical protein
MHGSLPIGLERVRPAFWKLGPLDWHPLFVERSGIQTPIVDNKAITSLTLCSLTLFCFPEFQVRGVSDITRFSPSVRFARYTPGTRNIKRLRYRSATSSFGFRIVAASESSMVPEFGGTKECVRFFSFAWFGGRSANLVS